MRKTVILSAVSLVLAVCLVPQIANAFNSQKGLDQTAIGAGIEAVTLKGMQERVKEIESSDNITNEEDQELYSLLQKIGEAEVANGTFDYKHELQLRVNSIETAVADNELAIENGWLDPETAEDAKVTDRELTKVIKKYKKELKRNNDTASFRAVEKSFEKDMNVALEYHEKQSMGKSEN